MEKIRLNEKNKIINENKLLKNYNDKDLEKIERFRHSKNDIEFCKTQILKIKEKIDIRQKQILENNKKIIQIDTGILDDKIKKQIKKTTNEHKKNKKKIEEDKVNTAKIKKEKISNMYKSMKEINKDIRDYNRSVKYGEKHFFRTTIPDHISKKLSNMPNNKGFIWKGIWYFGEKRSNNEEPIVMLSKNKNILDIHEWDDNIYKCYRKIGRDRKILVDQKFNINPYHKIISEIKMNI